MRTKRALSGTDIYHVMARGNGKQEIFLDEVDNRYFLKLLIGAKNAHEAKIYAYCLMGNHYHLLIECKTLPEFCKEVNQTYAHYFNAKNATVGHVFQSRYKSFPVENGDYLLCVLRYIHRNPVKAGMVASPVEYFWSSYKDYLSGEGLTTTYPILKLFDSKLLEARKRFISFSQKEDGFDFESFQAQEHFEDYKKCEALVKNWQIKKEKPCDEELKAMNLAIANETVLSGKEIYGILGISQTKYYTKIAKKKSKTSVPF
ncbi:MAG: transposase [Peptostreptococcaceae bacterium]|nr:transposase [Peptostreptococcaceae bacterium]